MSRSQIYALRDQSGLPRAGFFAKFCQLGPKGVRREVQVSMKWLPPEVWTQLKAGESCPMCAGLHLEVNEFSYKVAELRQSYVRLLKNQYRRGWTIVALKRHASELFELDDAELLGFWQDVAQVAEALDRIYRPAKISYGVMGFRCPHHCHLGVHSYEDDPHKPIDMNEKTVLLSGEEYAAMIAELRRALQDLWTKTARPDASRL